MSTETKGTGAGGEAVPASPAPSVGVRLPVGIALVSAAVLLMELLYTRIFSFAIWYHFAYATISMALLGFGASGAVLATFPRLLAGAGVVERVGRVAALGAVATVLGMAVIAATPFDPFEIPRAPVQLLYLTVYVSGVLVPFFLGGMCIAMILAARPQAVGILYFWDLAGAAAGAVAAIPLIDLLGATRGVASAALLLAAAGFVLRGVAPVTIGGLLVAVLAFPVNGLLEPHPAASKNLSHLLADPSVGLRFSRWNAVARIDVAGWLDPDDSRLRGAWSVWGGSLTHPTLSPPQHTITQDAGAVTPMYRFTGDFDELAFIDNHILRTPYVVKPASQVLVIGVGGGTDILTALKYGADHVTGVDINGVTMSLLREHFTDWVSDVYRSDPRVTIRVGEGRHFARQATGRYDVIQINGVDTLAAISSGAYVLAESYLYTVEAIRDLYARLADGGVLSVVFADPATPDTPPRHTLRLVSVMLEALENLGVPDPASQLLVVGAPERENVTRLLSRLLPTHFPVMSTDILLKKGAFSTAERTAVETFCDANGFIVWHSPTRGSRGHFAQLVVPRAARHAFVRRFDVDLSATTDDRPFFFNFYKWRDLPKFLRLQPARASATGQLVLLVMLVQAVVLGVLLIIAPLATSNREGLRVRGRGGALTYFACLGLGFMLFEVPLIQKFVLFLGHPTRSFSVTLAGLLVFTGLGSLASHRIRGDLARVVRRLVLVLVVLVTGYLVLLPSVFAAFLQASTAVRVVVALGLLAPLGLVLGMFFPLGIRSLPDARLVPWAWGVNGLTSVMGSVLAIIGAITYGFTLVVAAALVIYVVGAFVLRPETSSRVAGGRASV